MTRLISTRHSTSGLRPRLALGGILFLLSGCASVAVRDIRMTAAHQRPAPGALAVHVALAQDIQADPDAAKAALRLQACLVEAYRDAGLFASVASSGAPSAGDAMIRVRIIRADRGSQAERLLIGFGAGRSALLTKASFEVAGQAGAAMTFSASAKDGRKPGVILPGGVAMATGELSRLAIGGGLGLLMESRSGLDRGAKRSAAAIIKQTRLLYRASGWTWPSDQNGTRHNAPRKASSCRRMSGGCSTSSRGGSMHSSMNVARRSPGHLTMQSDRSPS
nr:DUF4410 domain-containing protein [Sphingobium yanoikuyae]